MKSTRSGLGEKSIEKISAFAAESKRSVWETLLRVDTVSGLDTRQKHAVRRLVEELAALRENVGQQPVAGAISLVLDFIAGHTTHAPMNHEAVDRLKRFSKPFGRSLTAFLHALALQDEADEYEFHVDRVSLMTLHSSKGLEFPIVFITGCEDGLLPYRHGREEPDLAEERRLLYVGMTRAQRKLYLTRARKRFLFGKLIEPAPSLFLANIEAALQELSRTRHKAREKKKTADVEDKQMRLL